MSVIQLTKYHCDYCGKELPTFENSLNIHTSINESNIGWSRLHVKIQNHHGSHNDGKTNDADLCQSCAIKLLSDALEKVKNGVRASKGTESIYEEKWNS